MTLRDEKVDIHREPADRLTTEEDLAHVQEGSFEVRETDEEPIVDKQARVVEELHIGELRSFDQAALDRDLGYELPDQLFAAYAGRPVLIAQELTTLAGS